MQLDKDYCCVQHNLSNDYDKLNVWDCNYYSTN